MLRGRGGCWFLESKKQQQQKNKPQTIFNIKSFLTWSSDFFVFTGYSVLTELLEKIFSWQSNQDFLVGGPQDRKNCSINQ